MIKVRGKVLFIPEEEATIAAVGDSFSLERIFHIDRFSPDGIDLSNLMFHLNAKFMDRPGTDRNYLEKSITEDEVILQWHIASSMTTHRGSAFIQLDAVDQGGQCRWRSYQGVVYIEESLDNPNMQSAWLSELEQLENQIDKKLDELEGVSRRIEKVEDDVAARMLEFAAERETLKQYAALSRSYATGDAEGINRPEQGRDNSRYYSTVAQAAETRAEAAKTGAEVAAEAAAEAARHAKTLAGVEIADIQDAIDAMMLRNIEGKKHRLVDLAGIKAGMNAYNSEVVLYIKRLAEDNQKELKKRVEWRKVTNEYLEDFDHVAGSNSVFKIEKRVKAIEEVVVRTEKNQDESKMISQFTLEKSETFPRRLHVFSKGGYVGYIDLNK